MPTFKCQVCGKEVFVEDRKWGRPYCEKCGKAWSYLETIRNRDEREVMRWKRKNIQA